MTDLFLTLQVFFSSLSAELRLVAFAMCLITIVALVAICQIGKNKK